jgi:SPP1 family predicted phage head-tail adaptor
MKSGKLRELGIYKKDTGTTQSSYGARNPNWQEFARTMLAIEEMKGNEFVQATQVVNGKPVRIRQRHVEGLDSHTVLETGGKAFEVVHVQAMDRRRHEQTVLCREVG